MNGTNEKLNMDIYYTGGTLEMGNGYYKQRDKGDKYAIYDNDRWKCSGKAEYAADGHTKRLDNISPASSKPGYHWHEWWSEEGGYGAGLHKNH